MLSTLAPKPPSRVRRSSAHIPPVEHIVGACDGPRVRQRAAEILASLDRMDNTLFSRKLVAAAAGSLRSSATLRPSQPARNGNSSISSRSSSSQTTAGPTSFSSTGGPAPASQPVIAPTSALSSCLNVGARAPLISPAEAEASQGTSPPASLVPTWFSFTYFCNLQQRNVTCFYQVQYPLQPNYFSPVTGAMDPRLLQMGRGPSTPSAVG